jgi:hypothetical protein
MQSHLNELIAAVRVLSESDFVDPCLSGLSEAGGS